MPRDTRTSTWRRSVEAATRNKLCCRHARTGSVPFPSSSAFSQSLTDTTPTSWLPWRTCHVLVATGVGLEVAWWFRLCAGTTSSNGESTMGCVRSVPAFHMVEQTHFTPLQRGGLRQERGRAACCERPENILYAPR